MIDARFEFARVDFIESIRENMIHSFNDQFEIKTNVNVEFDRLHNVIEFTLRLCVATHYAHNYAQRNNEFAYIDAFEIAQNENETLFAIIEYENEKMNHICDIVVDQKLMITIVNVD